MVNIVGSSQIDVITVINDTGSNNGSSVGSPVDNISARSSNDHITITSSTVSGDIRAHAGDDTLVADDATLNSILMGVGEDQLEFTNSTVSSLGTNTGNDTVIATGSTFGSLSLGGGNDRITLLNTGITGSLTGNSGTDTMVLPAGTLVNDGTHGTFTVVAGETYDLRRGEITLPTGQTISYTTFETAEGIACFQRGTDITTRRGLVKVENLTLQDAVYGYDGKFHLVKWVGSKTITAADIRATQGLAPICIQAGALGAQMPGSDLYVSPQHRVLIRSKIAQRILATPRSSYRPSNLLVIQGSRAPSQPDP